MPHVLKTVIELFLLQNTIKNVLIVKYFRNFYTIGMQTTTQTENHIKSGPLTKSKIRKLDYSVKLLARTTK